MHGLTLYFKTISNTILDGSNSFPADERIVGCVSKTEFPVMNWMRNRNHTGEQFCFYFILNLYIFGYVNENKQSYHQCGMSTQQPDEKYSNDSINS
jgi:hypothetical protein